MIRLIFLFLAVGSFFLPTVFAHSQTQVIEMASNSFEPQTVTVDIEQTIIFLNVDNVDRWPASNTHPTHDIYPEFDPKKPIKPGESWSFKPKNAGSWKYHDHLNPHIRGIIEVQKEEGANDEKSNENIITKIFLGVKQWAREFMDKFSASLMKSKKEDPDLAWNNLKEKYKGQGGSIGNIHDQAHLIGGLIYESSGLGGLSKCSPEFAFGCYHGFLDKAFQKNLDKLSEAEKACKTLGDGGPSASCIHGIGHGIASFYQSADLKASLSSCKRLGAKSLQYCFDGVFMEFERSAPQSFYKTSNPYYPCDEMEQIFGTEIGFACGRNQPTVLMSKFKFSFEDVIEVCLKSPSDPFKTACFDALGFISTKSTSNPDDIVSACRKIGVDEYILRCAKAAAGELIFQEIPGWQTNASLICKSLGVNYSSDCQGYINELIRQYGRKISEGDENEYIRNQLNACYGSGGRDDCYKKAAGLFFNRFGLKKTLELLQSNENYPEVYARCHEVTHYLSRSEYERLGSVAGVYAACDSTCHGGCYHGTLEAYLKENTNADFAKICGQRADYQKPLEFNECLHGLGHAAMFVTDMELKQSLSLCDSLTEQDFKERCYSGVFMENSSSSTSFDHASVYIKADDPYYPCNILDEKYQPLCWQYQSSYFSIINHQDWVKVAGMCLQIPGKYQDLCFRTIGTNQVGFTTSLNIMRDDCNLMPSDHFKEVCVMGVVSSLTYRFVGEMDKMTEFCDIVDDKFKEGCFRQIGTGLLDWNSDKNLAKKSCQTIPDPRGSAWCLSVI